MATPSLKVIFQNDAFVAIDKPEGLLVHKSAIDKHETQFLLQQLRDQLGKYLYPIHRLDKPTSGIILFAFDPQSAAHIQQQMEDQQARKEYLLVCRGYCPEQGEINHPLKIIDDFKSKRKKPKPQKPAQEAITEYQRLATIELPTAIDKYPSSRYSLVKARLITGRKHQLRRHFKHISHPIIGCPKYGKSLHNRYFAEQLACSRLLLHAYQLSLTCPLSDKPLQLTAPPSGQFLKLLNHFSWQSTLTPNTLSPRA